MKRLVRLFALLAVFAAGTLWTSQPASATPTWWNSSWGFRAEVNVAAADALASGYSLSLTIPHATYVSAGDSLASGNDVRVVRWNGSAWAELDRVVDSGSSWNSASTTIWFRTQAAISASATDTSYWLYYGNSSAGTPPANGDNVFDLYDDFSAGSINGSKWNVWSPAGISVTSTGGELKISGTTQSGSEYNPAGIYSTVDYTSGFAVESRFRIVSESTTAQADWKANFGLDASYLMVNSQASATKRTQYYSAGWQDVGPSTLNGQTFGYQRVSESMSTAGVARHSENGVFQSQRTGLTPGPYAAQFSFNPDVGGGGETSDVRFDDVAVRKYVANEPTTTLGGVDGAEAQVPMTITIAPAMTLTVGGKNGNCNGLTNTIGATATATTIPLSHLSPTSQVVGAQDLTLSTNAANGATVRLRSNSTTSPVMTNTVNSSFHVADATAGPLPSAGTEAFGFTTSDVGIAMTSGNVAPVPNSSSSTNVMSATGPVSRTSCVAFFGSMASTTPAGPYQTVIVYTAVPSF